MTIRRQYSLPNCQLVVEGVGQDELEEVNGRPLLSTVTTVECRFAGNSQPVVGGRAFLENLAVAVSAYAQEYLSGVQHPIAHESHHRRKLRLVHLEKVDANLHRLTVQPEIVNPEGKDKAKLYQSPETSSAQIDLTTVQFFDLVEAIDQLFADGQTLPELAIDLSPLSRRYAAAQEPMAKRATPAVLGLSGLAIAALAAFYLPVPTVRRPEPSPRSTSQESPASTATPGASPTPTNTPGAGSSPDVGAVLNTAPAITDSAQVDELLATLQQRLYEEWRNKPEPTFQEDLIYRVGVAENGDIVGYKYVNDAALQYVNEIPLSDVTYDPTRHSPQAPLAQFRVVFGQDEVLEVSPWDGASGAGTESVPPSSP
jgi:hypothetical protein